MHQYFLRYSAGCARIYGKQIKSNRYRDIKMAVDVIIPTYKPDQQFLLLMDRLEKQAVRPDKIIIINTGKAYFEQLITEKAFLDIYDNAVIVHVGEPEFDHGGSRNLAVSLSQSPSFIMMTQDAVPSDNFLIGNLLKALDDKKTAVAYARQCPTEESNQLERYVRAFNYGEEPLYKTEQDLKSLGIKTYFCSNVCAAYNAEVFERLGGFVGRTIFNEDMIYAATAIKAGYAVQYVPAAAVIHAHNYTNRQQFCRNFDLGVSHADHPEVFDGLSSESEGLRMIRSAAVYLLKNGAPWLILKLFTQSLSKYRGYYLGKRYQKLSRKRILRFTMNPYYWR